MRVDAQAAVCIASAVLIVLILFRRVLWSGVKLTARTALGCGVLAVLSALGSPLGVNLVNALVLGVLGVPGFGLLWVLCLVTG